MHPKNLIFLILLALPLTLLAQDDAVDTAQLQQELEGARLELAEAAKRLAEIQRQLNNEQLGLHESSRMVFRFDDETVDLEELHELTQEFQSSIGSDISNIEVFRLGEFDKLPPRLGLILADDFTVMGVTPSSGAGQAGIEQGDVLQSINGQPLTGNQSNNIREILADFNAGDSVPVEIMRGDQVIMLDVVTQPAMRNFEMILDNIDNAVPGMGMEMEMEMEIVTDTDGRVLTERFMPPAAPRPPFPMAPMLGGNTDLISNHAGLEPYFGTGEGIVVLRINEDNTLNLKSGDVLLRVNQEDVQRPVDLGRTLLLSGEAGEVVTLEVMRNSVLTQLQGTIPEPMQAPSLSGRRSIHIERHPARPEAPKPPAPPDNSY